jgi:DNA-binding NarL/FixJ family response regulator
MVQRRVLIIDAEYLPGAGVRSLLSKQDNIHVQATRSNSTKDMLRVIDAFRPNVIVMFEDVLEKSVRALVTSLRDYPSIRTIVLHWDDNEILISDSQKVMIKEIGDFLAVL